MAFLFSRLKSLFVILFIFFLALGVAIHFVSFPDVRVLGKVMPVGGFWLEVRTDPICFFVASAEEFKSLEGMESSFCDLSKEILLLWHKYFVASKGA